MSYDERDNGDELSNGMDDDGVWGGDMPNLPFRRRNSDPADAQQLDELLDAGRFDAAPVPEWQSVSDILHAAALPVAASDSSFADEAAIVAAFRRERDSARQRRFQPIARYKTMVSTRPFSTLLTGRIAIGLTAGVVTLTGAATAAYACVLPTPLQSIAHSTIDAPSPSSSSPSTVSAVDFNRRHHHDPAASATPSVASSVSAAVTTSTSTSTSPSPSVTRSPAVLANSLISYRLCGDYAAAQAASKTLDAKELAALTKLASSSASITAFCAALPPLPAACPVVTSTATVTPAVSPTPATSGSPTLRPLHWVPWCGACPQLRPHPSVSPSSTETATATSTTDTAAFNFWCGFRDPRHHDVNGHGDANKHDGPPTVTTSPTAHPTFTFGPHDPGQHH
jgi:hypothetical protein